MIAPDPRFRLNPKRALYVHGEINDGMVSGLLPYLLRLQQESRDPITVYINSDGGSVKSMEDILHLLRLRDQSLSAPCSIITCVTVRASSAAADLLSAGDFAVAFPRSIIHFHGLRFPRAGYQLTAEYTSVLAYSLRRNNSAYAMDLMSKIETRFMFRYTNVRNEFDEVRSRPENKDLSDLECLLAIVRPKLTQNAREVCERALERNAFYQKLLAKVTRKSKDRKKRPDNVKVEADAIKSIIEHEMSMHKKEPDWTFSRGGIIELVNDFYVFVEYMDTFVTDRLQTWCDKFGQLVLDKAETAEINSISDNAKKSARIVEFARPKFEPIWPYFVALCHTLQEGENEFTATDAYWLGLIDEVVGEPLLSIRDYVEYRPDTKPEPPALSK